ncbi:hypothetical protein BC830DRAFT_1158966 [Chytriomyces sp. MP71]|nr:hypothetical protein BC830DRAFT_1158966 [Chytriomyces sp. MP71]
MQTTGRSNAMLSETSADELLSELLFDDLVGFDVDTSKQPLPPAQSQPRTSLLSGGFAGTNLASGGSAASVVAPVAGLSAGSLSMVNMGRRASASDLVFDFGTFALSALDGLGLDGLGADALDGAFAMDVAFFPVDDHHNHNHHNHNQLLRSNHVAIPSPTNSNFASTLLAPSFAERNLSTSAPTANADFLSLFAKSFKNPPVSLTAKPQAQAVTPSPEISPLPLPGSGRRGSFSTTSPALGGTTGARRSSFSIPSGYDTSTGAGSDSPLLHRPRSIKQFKTSSNPALAAARESASTASAHLHHAAPHCSAAATTGTTFVMDTRPRDHVCVICGNKFLRRQDLMRHEVTHSTVKNFTCLYGCGASFGRSDALGRHMKSGRCRAQMQLQTEE